MVWIWVRRVVQIACLLLFIYLLTTATFPVDGPLAPQFFLQMDVLAAATATISRNPLPVMMFYVAIATLAATLLLGRAFCGWVCPLGTCVDISDRVFTRKRKRAGAKHNRPGVKYGILAAVLASSVFGIQIAWFVDPIPLVTRAFALVIFPIAGMAQRIAVIEGRPILKWLEKVLNRNILPIDLWDAHQFQLSLVAAGVFVGILGLGALSRRYWCRSLCPLGALLAFVGRFGMVKRRVKDTCIGCKACVHDCKMGAIPAKEPTTTKLPECILCFNCKDCKAEENDTTTFGLAWLPTGAKREVDITRRRTLQTLGGGAVYGMAAATMLTRSQHHPKLIRPPGAITRGSDGKPVMMREDQFRDLCLRCGECMKACITGGIQPALHEAGWDGVFTPVLKPSVGWCERECTACGDVCPTGAMRPFLADEKTEIMIGLAYIDSNRCLAWRMGEHYKLCLVCDEQCSYKAVKWMDVDGIKRPVVEEAKCTGCGICEAKCPVQPLAAIVVDRSEKVQ